MYLLSKMGSVCEDCKFESQPLIKAAEYGLEQCVLSLMKLGADVNEKDSFRYTTLINAVTAVKVICTSV